MQQKSRPSVRSIEAIIKRYKLANKYPRLAPDAAKHLIRAFPKNAVFEHVYIKVNYINGAFKTRIGDTLQIAQNIHKISGLDRRLKQGDPSLIAEIQNYKSKSGRDFRFYSFATKYCYCHNPQKFPIFDQNVKTSLEFYRDTFKDAPKFATARLRDYDEFLRVITGFIEFAKAKSLSIPVIDHYLWIHGQTK